MDRQSTASTVGIASCVVVLGIVALPYLVVPPQGTQTYYDVGPLGPVAVAAFAAGAIVAFAAATRNALSPALAAGGALALTAAMVAVSAIWAWAVWPSLVMELVRIAGVPYLLYHRYVLVVVAAVALASAVWLTAGTVRRTARPVRTRRSG